MALTVCRNLMLAAAKQMELSARAYHRVPKLACTFTQWPHSGIAALSGEDSIQSQHPAEARQCRPQGPT